MSLPGAELRIPQYMVVTLAKAYELFKAKHPDYPHCQRSFEILRPACVYCSTQEVRHRCCCIIHVSAQLLFTALVETHKKQGLSFGMKSAGDILGASYCQILDGPFHQIDKGA